MANYILHPDSCTLLLKEQPIYGSSRLGVYAPNKDVTSNTVPSIGAQNAQQLTLIRGQRLYELSNWLGNVQVVITDKKLAICGSAQTPAYYEADIQSAQDYYPFGSLMPERNFNSAGYKYGFNGKEKDDEVKGNSAQYDYGFRIYNPRLGRFLSVDPLFESYPWLSTYQFAQNDPIRNIDIDGLEGGSAIEYVFTIVGRDVEAWWNSWSLSSLPSLAPNKSAPPINNNSRQPVLKKPDAATIANQVQRSSNTAFKKDINLSESVPFVSQQNFPNPSEACCIASQKILRDFGIKSAGAKSNRIIIGKNSADNSNIEATKDARAGVDYINEQLEFGNPIMVGVNHNLNKGQKDKEAADHFVVIVGRKYDKDKKQYYFNFYEVGYSDESKGKSDANRLYVNDNNTITGTNYAGKRKFTVTDVRKNK
jgi:RHS repeat-associated protein